ncbi:MAG: hypothetical protein NE334_21315 [Lentisphaeraceae bacterium]|nr:hypothetical protein [Lentisphaeraceae bacterium]
MSKLAILICLLFSINLTAQDLVISKKGKLLYEENFEALTKRLKVGMGQWQIVDGKHIKGKQLKKDKHTAFRKMFLDHQDVIYQFDVKFEGKAYAKLLINYDLVHIANCLIKTDQLVITKLNEYKKRMMMATKAKKQGKPIEEGQWQKKNILLDQKPLSTEKNKWYTVTIELVNDELVATIGDVTVRGKHPGLKERKTNFGIQAAGLDEYVHFDNLKIWEALVK